MDFINRVIFTVTFTNKHHKLWHIRKLVNRCFHRVFLNVTAQLGRYHGSIEPRYLEMTGDAGYSMVLINEMI